MSDEDLITAIATGDEQAAELFVQRQKRRISALAFAVTGDRDLAEDVAQETFLRVWRHAGLFDREKGTASAWTGTIARNVAADAARRRVPLPLDPVEVLEALTSAVHGEVEDRALESELRGRLLEALSHMPPAQRRAVLLSFVVGLTAEEISKREGIPVGTAKSRIRLALIKIRAHLVEPEE